jgi:glycosyltransferase involved in cell wall biosynthesis
MMKTPERICYLSFATLPSETAHSVHIVNMCQSIKKTGCSVTLMANLAGTPQEIFEHYNIKHPFQMKNIRLNKIRFLGRFLALVNMFFSVKKIKSDLLYTRDIFNGWLACRLGIPFIFEIHELPMGRTRRFILSRILSNPDLKRIVFISESMKSHFEKTYSSIDVNSCVAHDGVTLANFESLPHKSEQRTRLGLPVSQFIAGYIGSLFPGRGLDIVLGLAARLPEVLFLVVGGEGKYLSDLKARLGKLQLKNVLPVGYVPYRSIPGYMNTCDILLMPYQKQVLHRQAKHDTVKYMSPLKMFEYMAASRPIVSSRISVLEEVLQNNVNSILVQPNDLNEWEKALKKLIRDSKFAQTIAAKAKKDVLNFSWDQRTNIIFNNLIN